MSDMENPADVVGDDLLPDERAARDIERIKKQAAEAPEPEAEEKTDDDTEGQEENPPAEPDEDKGEDKSRSKERRERRKAHMERLEREAREAREGLERLRRAAEGESEPKEADFTDFTEYSIAKAAWRIDRQRVARESDGVTERAAAIETERRRALAESYREQVADAKPRYRDFDAVVNNPSVLIAPHIADMVMESDLGADLAYALASQPDEAARISRMNPVAAAREIGRLEASIMRPKPRFETNAPPPVKPVNARGAGAKSPEHLSYAEYKKAREAGKI